MDRQIILQIESSLSKALSSILDQEVKAIVLPCKDNSICDLFSPSCMQLSKKAGVPPYDLAQRAVEALDKDDALKQLVSRIEAKSGFVNFFISSDMDEVFLSNILSAGAGFLKGFLPKEKRKKILFEFVSANPTGPLSIAHARQAAIGDALARILRYGGCEVTTEYYLNDVGFQIRLLGQSLMARVLQETGQEAQIPENGYQGSYLADIAKNLLRDNPNCLNEFSDDDFAEYAVEKILITIKSQLAKFGVEFDNWYSQKEMESIGKVEDALDILKNKGLLYEKDGALWFKSSQFGDDKDRVLIKSDGAKTYFTADIAYHRDKFQRGYEYLINIWGPDHHGYIPRLKAVIEALGFNRDSLYVIIAQLVTLFKNNQPLKMSTRAGQYITIGQLMEQVGRDASRFFLIMRRTNSHLDFDMDLAVKQAPENPVYYVQYAHARACRIIEMAKSAGLFIESRRRFSAGILSSPEEKSLIHGLRSMEIALNNCAGDLDPFPLVNYLKGLAGLFHKFYEKRRVLSEDIARDVSYARLALVSAVMIALRLGLELLGISAPERM